MTITYCRDCINVHTDTRGGQPWDWRCAKVAVAAGFGFVDPEFAPNPPFAKCNSINTSGACAMFSPIPEPPGTEQPKTRQFEQHKREIAARR